MAKRTEAHLSPISNNNGNVRVSTAGTKAAPGSKLVSYSINWGDGTPNQTGIKPPIELIHEYKNSGNYTIILNVKDSKNRIAEDTMGMIVQINSGSPIPPPVEGEYNFYCQGGGYNGIGTVRQTDGSNTDLDAKIALANDGDIICLPESGNFNWTAGVVIDNKNLFILGPGKNTINIHNTIGNLTWYVVARDASHGKIRMSGMGLSGIPGTVGIKFDSGSFFNGFITNRFRVNDIKFDYDLTIGSRIGIQIVGPWYGLIDQNIFNMTSLTDGGGFPILFQGYIPNELIGGGGNCGGNPAGNLMASQPLDYGTNNFVFVEENQINKGSGIDTDHGASRATIRYNIFTGNFLYSHWTEACEYNALVYEVYNNEFIGTSDYGQGSGPLLRQEAGTGVFYNNSALGNWTSPFIELDDRRSQGQSNVADFGLCDGTKSWDGNAGDPSAPGWPCLGQTGRAPGKTFAQIIAGDKQESSPFTLWNNGIEIGCSNGGTCSNTIQAFMHPAAYIKTTPHPNGEVDVVQNNTPLPGYTSYTYPHPMRSEQWP